MALRCRRLFLAMIMPIGRHTRKDLEPCTVQYSSLLIGNLFSTPLLVIRRYAFCSLVVDSRYRSALLLYLGWFLGGRPLRLP